MKTAIYPGSFDPITLGHLDIIRRAAACFDKLYVCVMVNAEKKNPMFTDRERLELIRQSVADIPNVEAELWSGLLADYARERDSRILVKGLRHATDFDQEYQMAAINKGLCPDLETVFLPAQEKYQFISSSAIKEIAAYGGNITDLVPSCVARALKK